MDMVGRLRPDKTTGKDKLIVYGTGTSMSFAGRVDRFNEKHGFQIQKVAGAGLGGERSTSDHATFYAHKIPVLFFFTGNHADYHRPSDTADKINVAGMERVADFVEAVADQLAREPKRPAYVRVKAPPGPAMPHPGKMPRLGIRPSYGDEGEGVLLDGVSDNSPAQKAGFQEGDRIVEMAGQPVKNLEAYMVLLARQKRGQPLEVVVLREGRKKTITVTPE
jgi:C-terminal processing protease CtpA/Prc